MKDKYYVFLNLNNPIARNNFEASGRITSSGFSNALTNESFREKYLSGSADYLPFVPNQNCDSYGVSLFSLGVTDCYRIEYNAEICRRSYFSHLPSRLSCVFAFKSLEDCEKAIRLYKWNGGNIKEFRLESSPFNKVHKANMEIISLTRGLAHKSCLDPSEENKLWSHYWSGDGNCKIDSPLIGCHESGEIWEYLIEGSLVHEKNT